MSKQANRNDLEKAFLDAVKEINIENAAQTEPFYSLTEILALKNMTELRQLGKVLQVKYYGKLPKAELIPAIAETLKQSDTLRNCLYTLNEIEWEFFQKAAAKKHLQTDKVYIDSYHIPQKMGLLQCFYHKDKLWFVVPKELRAAYRIISETDFLEDKRFRDLLNRFAIAAVSLYGVISQDDFVELFNSHNERQTNIDEMFPLLLNNVYNDVGYCFWDEYIVDDSFEQDEFAGVKRLLSERSGKPRYNPTREDFLNYSDWDYYEVTPQLITIKQHLSKLIDDPDVVEEILDEIHNLSAVEARTQNFFDLLDSAGVVFDNMEQAGAIMQLIVDVRNNTRLWTNYGHTPNELSSREKSNLRLLPSVQTKYNQKIGRNDPCPCGSGRKYKKCCGR
ncbi:SEC-C metal-binding domain-containing protein [Desulfosporosinus nitroreducens]|uniref:SEC-C metal-binding domain-containing protein n=1 Tax=Desulfosporosinus nitroreducens TaxID=2018668 RepID=A0ABT8QMT7_9FIRM|nr:SEC-C metal-binding domain-containing protein [Desulfosporosinus nitroreducens]MDO0822653.1 SEC-C metal-binding domain-containing protein [Desulfosporosinus nitroreducens]